ncbi:MAG: hypothetical protein H6767_08160 [Candidatus Peribacteria bacterium]|nr:MAG: hypothetical protein H6767_08160 [Candidatus Peribacteria bacterium]
MCDYCLEKRQFESGDVEKLVPLSVFGIALDVVGQFDKRFGITVISNFLRGSEEKKILEWGLDSKKNYGIFSDYTGDLIIAILEALLRYGFLEKTTGQYPVIGLSKIGRVALKREDLIKEDESNLQSFISMKCKNQKQKKGKQGKTKSPTKSEGNTYEETLKLLQL